MYWLSVERYENWLADKNAGFKFLGISARKLKLAEKLSAGDYIITYISSGKSSFSDIRKVTSNQPSKFKSGIVYDEPFPYQVTTIPDVILDERDWIKIHEVIDALTFLPKDKDWRQIMRSSLRALNDNDAAIIIKNIKKRVDKI